MLDRVGDFRRVLVVHRASLGTHFVDHVLVLCVEHARLRPNPRPVRENVVALLHLLLRLQTPVVRHLDTPSNGFNTDTHTHTKWVERVQGERVRLRLRVKGEG